jgi:beta-glucosidase
MKPENLQAARDMARASVVLLKNDNHTLPIADHVQTIAVIGPMANNRRDLIGSWSAAGDWTRSVTLLEGLQNRYPNHTILHAQGTDIDSDNRDGFPEALAAASGADLVILALGEYYWMSGEAASRADIGLPGIQQDLALEVKSLGKPTVAVIMSGRPLTLNRLDTELDALLQAWFLGTTTGDALADVLSGDFNPSGKLPVTFPYHVGQIPIYHSELPTGRPFNANNKYTSKYLDIPNEPLYVFGHGLSYTTFSYGNIQLSSPTMRNSETITATITVTNTGNLAGEEVVQLYLNDPLASISRPVRELKAFQKIHLEPGQTQTVSFVIHNEMLSFYNNELKWGSEPGQFNLFIGGSSKHAAEVEFTLLP